ncbi:hypothetical protein RHMOL_RhmolUnG0003500 [Rhododendron molle]|nr:hypothetical protein RHMOL_RhmolUnG0003500 [Rhododendron molle]
MDDVPSPYIVVGTPSELDDGIDSKHDGILQIYRVDTKLWEEPQEFENKLGPELWGLVEHPAAVDKKLYWFSIHGNYLAGYDLVSKAWFRGRVHIHDRRDYFGDSDLRC